MIRHFSPLKFDLEISVEIPDISGAPIPASRAIIRNQAHPRQAKINTVNSMTIYFTSGNIIWAELEMYADYEGNPILDGKPYIKDNTILLAIFKAKITEFRSGVSYREGFAKSEGAVHV